MAPKYGIVIPVYNRSEYLRQAIASCVKQTADDFQIIVADDCSPQDLGSVANSFHDSRVKYYRNESRLGAARNHQHAVSLSTATYVITLHSDDLLLPKCLEIAGAALDNNPTAAAVYFSHTYLLGSELQGFHPMPRVRFANARTLRDNPWLEKFHGTNPSCCLFRRAAFDFIGGYRTSIRFAYDWEIYMRFMRIGGGIIFLPQILCIYRKHEDQAVETSSIQGLYDVLDLWMHEDYSHWPAWEIADLILLCCRRDKKIFEILREVTRRHLVRRVLSGVPRALYEKLRRRIGLADVKADQNYEKPINLDYVIKSVPLEMQSILRSCESKTPNLEPSI
jgi:glycosyltransferase involved in cell wall biosynthesis